jgi:hypothetical protein
MTAPMMKALSHFCEFYRAPAEAAVGRRRTARSCVAPAVPVLALLGPKTCPRDFVRKTWSVQQSRSDECRALWSEAGPLKTHLTMSLVMRSGLSGPSGM